MAKRHSDVPSCCIYHRLASIIRMRITPSIVKALVSVLILFFVYSCASAPKKQDMNLAEAHNKLGSTYLNNGQINEAYIEYQKALALNPNNKETLNYLGFLSAQFNKPDEAIAYYKRALSIDPEYSEAANNLGVIYSELGRWDESIMSFQAALNNPLYRSPENAYSNLGYAYYMKEDYHSAERSLKEALFRNPVLPTANFILGLVYVKLDSDDKAITEFKKAIGMNSDYLDAHWEIARAYLRKGNKAKALKHFRVVAEKESNPVKLRQATEQIENLKYTNQ